MLAVVLRPLHPSLRGAQRRGNPRCLDCHASLAMTQRSGMALPSLRGAQRRGNPRCLDCRASLAMTQCSGMALAMTQRYEHGAPVIARSAARRQSTMPGLPRFARNDAVFWHGARNDAALWHLARIGAVMRRILRRHPHRVVGVAGPVGVGGLHGFAGALVEFAGG